MPIAQAASLAQFAPHPDIGHLFIEERVEIAGRGFCHDSADWTTALAERF
jgi:hypothetical protein